MEDYIFLFYSVANKIKMGKKLEKGLKEKNTSAVSQDEENPNKTQVKKSLGTTPFFLFFILQVQ